jgi:hypothetical protein
VLTLLLFSRHLLGSYRSGSSSRRASCGSWESFFGYQYFLGWWYIANVSIIFDAPCLFYTNCFMFCLHFVAFLCIFWK